MGIKGLGHRGLVPVAAAALTLAACSTTADSGDGDGGSSSTVFRYGHEQEFSSYNVATFDGAATKNAIVMNRVTPGFWRFGPDGSIEPETDFGTYEKVSDDPLTVRYTFNDNAVWSDGEPIDCDDAYLQWVANSGEYESFDAASTSGYSLMEAPQCEDGDKEFTIVYTQPFADWEAMFDSFLPAHVVERESGVDDIIQAARDGDADAMAKAGEFWTSGWVFNSGELPDESLIPSSGPYKISSWVGGQYITLTANENWWGEAPKTPTVEIRFISQDAQAQALQNGEINAMDPQPNRDLKSQLQTLADDTAATVSTGDLFTFEHLDYNFDSEVWADPRVREAFALCVPRQLIVDNLIKPLNSEAVVMQSRYYFPFQEEYDEVASAIVGPEYDEPNIERAKELLAEAGVTNPTVSLVYETPNQRRSNQADLIIKSCEGAGFTIEDNGSKSAFDEDGPVFSGNFDVVMFAWAGSALVTDSQDLYTTDGGGNFGAYSNPEVDSLLEQLNGATEQEEQIDLITQIETILWDDLATIPLFAFPGIAAASSNAEGVVLNVTQDGLTWNMEDWALQQ